MSENILPPVWPPRRTRLLPFSTNNITNDHNHALQSNYAVPAIPSIPQITDSNGNQNPLLSIVWKQWQNGYEKEQQAKIM
jgi:hypothetical protein